MFFQICSLLILIALYANAAKSPPVKYSPVVVTTVTTDDLKTMSKSLPNQQYYQDGNYWNLFCDSSFGTRFDIPTSQYSPNHTQDLILTMKNLKSNYRAFCDDKSLKQSLSLSKYFHPDTVIRYSVCQTSITKLNTTGFCATPVWSDEELYRLVTKAQKYNNVVCSSLQAIHYSMNYLGGSSLADQILIDLMNSPFCNSTQSTTIGDPVSFIKNVMCKTASGQNSPMCQFASEQTNIVSLCQGFLTLNGRTNKELVVNSWKPGFGVLTSDPFFEIPFNVAVGSAFSGNPNATLRTLICTEPFICPPATPSCP